MTSGRLPSILCVTSELPWPLDSGGHLRTYHLLRALAGKFEVRLVTAVADRSSAAAIEQHGVDVKLATIPARTVLREASRSLQAFLTREPYVLYHRHNQPAIRTLLRKEISSRKPDLLYFDHLDSCVFADEVGRTPFVADFHNVYSLIAEREASQRDRNLLVRRYLAREARLLAAMEQRAASRSAAVLAVSEEERDYYNKCGGRTVLVPNGVDCDRYQSLPVGRHLPAPNLLFVGSLSWAPNVAASQFLARRVLPEVRKRHSECRLTIVGKNPPAEVLALDDLQAVTVAGNVPDITPYLADASLLAVPLTVGGGTRLKILEGFAAGLPVVSTPVGAEGIRALHDRDLIIAELDEFADATASLLSDPERTLRIAASARALAEDHYDWRAIGDVAVRACERVLTEA